MSKAGPRFSPLARLPTGRPLNMIEADMNFEALRSRLEKAFSGEKQGLRKIALQIHNNPEVSFQERKTAQLLEDYLSRKGFRIRKGLGRLETSFRAVSAIGKKPAVAFLAELDALAGLGHACGHNLIAASSAGAAVILRKAFPALAGSVEVIGCPAEERGGGKIYLCNAGVFDHLDFAMLVHPSDRTEIYKLSLALIEIEMVFLGKSAHAAANPEKGINALDAAIQTFNDVNALRSRLGAFARVNGIITEGGKAPNIIPDRARVEFWVRDDTLDKTLRLARLVAGAGKAAARGVGAKVKINLRSKLAYKPFIPNRTAGNIFREIFEKLGVKIEQGDEKTELGSTDLGNLSWIVPALHPALAITKGPVAGHSKEFAAAAKSGLGLEMMEKAALAMALLGYRVMTDRELRRRMRAELERSCSGR